MAQGDSQTTVANEALARVGAAPCTDIEDPASKGARECLANFNSTVQEVGRAGHFNCITKRTTMGQLLTGPLFGWSYQYQLPPDYLEVIALNDKYDCELWTIEGDLLLTDQSPCSMKYTYFQPSPAKWDALYREAVICRLAAKICPRLKQDAELASSLWTAYERIALPRAKQKGKGERKDRRFNPADSSRSIRARFVRRF